MGSVTAILDSCVLYPAPLRDLLMRLSLAGLFLARWTDRIHDEWTRSILRERPDLNPDRLARTRRLMDENAIGAPVTGYEVLIDDLHLPDPDDRHVLAAAIHAGAGVIVTKNLRHFPDAALRPHGVEAEHPDEFIARLLSRHEDTVVGVARAQRAALKNPPASVEQFLGRLAEQDLKRTVQLLSEHPDRL